MLIMRKLSLLIIILAISSCSKIDENTLTIYSSRQPQLIEPLLESFELETGIKIELLTGDAPQLLQRLKSEGGMTQANIFMTVDAGTLWQAASEDIFHPIDSKILEENIPSYLRDSEKRWFGFSKRIRTIVYSKEKVDPENLSTIEDLASEKWDNKLCLRTSRKVYNRSLLASMIDNLGYEQSKSIVKGWVNNFATPVFSNDTNALKAVAEGPCHVTIVNTYYLARLLDTGKYDQLEIFWSNQSNRGAHVNITGAGVVKSSKNKLNAIKFLEYLSTKEAQDIYASLNYEFPVNTRSELNDLIKKWGTFKEDEIPVERLGKLQREAVKLAQEAEYF
jgi:iron(III) transport system substrate-binding protein